MNTKDILINDFSDARFQQAFKLYFRELGMNIWDWPALFKEMNREKGCSAIVRLTEDDRVVGFLQFQPIAVSAGFFKTKWGFVREFWVAPEFRGGGHGSALLELTEAHLRRRGCSAAVLTTETAAHFYEARGYRREPEISAKNKLGVHLKQL